MCRNTNILTDSPRNYNKCCFSRKRLHAEDQLSSLGMEGQHLSPADYYTTRGHVRSTPLVSALQRNEPWNPSRAAGPSGRTEPLWKREARHGSAPLKAARKQAVCLARRRGISPQTGKQKPGRIRGTLGEANQTSWHTFI